MRPSGLVLLALLTHAQQAPAQLPATGRPAAPVVTTAATPESLRERLAAGGELRYSMVNLDTNTKSVITVRRDVGDEYVRNDGGRLKDLSHVQYEQGYKFSPPVPMFRLPLEPGSTWTYSGAVLSMRAQGGARMHSDFLVAAASRLTTPAGDFDVVEVVEHRSWESTTTSARFVIHRWIDAQRGVVVRETLKTEQVYRKHINIIMPTDFELTLERLPQ